MIKKLRIKFIASIMLMLTLVLVLIFASLNLVMIRTGEQQTFALMQKIADNDGQLQQKKSTQAPESIQPEGSKPGKISLEIPAIPESQTNFSVKLDSEGVILAVISQFPDQVTAEDIEQLVAAVLAEPKTQGKLAATFYLIEPKPYGSIIVFSNGQTEDNIMSRLLEISIYVGLISLVPVFLIAFFLAKWAVKPVETAFEKQRRFIADASHELKTPLTIINTNADVLHSEIGDNKWLGYIQSEALRMSKLVTDLLYLTKYDTQENIYENQLFNLSEAVTGAVLPFESVLYEAGKTLTTDIDANLLYHGDEGKLKQLVVILLDNAVKHSRPNSSVTVRLKQQENRYKLSVHNFGEGIEESERERIFERFYRVDTSRARDTGGYGLGLAIAKSIVDGNKGRIQINGKTGEWVEFVITF